MPDVEKFVFTIIIHPLNRSSPKSYHLHLECSRKLMLCSSYRGDKRSLRIYGKNCPSQILLTETSCTYLRIITEVITAGWIIIFISSRISSIVTFRGFPLKSPSVLFFVQFLLSMRLLSALSDNHGRLGGNTMPSTLF